MSSLPLFRGVATIGVERAKNLIPRQGILSKAVSQITKPFSCASEQLGNKGGTYVKVKVGEVKIGQTHECEKKRNPVWSETFRVDVAHETEGITFEIRCEEIAGDPLIGILILSAEDIMNYPDDPTAWTVLSLLDTEASRGTEQGWFPLSNKEKTLTNGSLKITIQFKPVPQLIGQKSVDDSYFMVQEACKMTLYQDAHTPSHPRYKDIVLDDGSKYAPASAWNDMLASIESAKKFIYIAGWSVWTKLIMNREESAECLDLGTILSRKAREGVQVLGLVWDEKASTSVLPGLMGTHDEETYKFFRDTGVDIQLVYRKKEAGSKIFSQASEWCYSHHQKCIIVDAEHPTDSNRRSIVAYIGGLDLAMGRYDTPDHPLFSTLSTVHKGDFYQNCVKVSEELGPRQPWHDIHCKVEGPVAFDIMVNFEERWKKLPGKGDKLIDVLNDDTYDVNCAADCVNGEEWECQLLRSITSDSAEFNADLDSRLTKKAGARCDDSIHRGYVQHIRRAERFIYIENQYFLGSAYAWQEGQQKPKAHHIIPFEITNRIIEKIEADQPFCVYIVIPMFPEGSPSSKPVQEILFWQRKTVEMMYRRIQATIDDAGRSDTASPTDYLKVYCLGKREAEEPIDLPRPKGNTVEATLRLSRRFMVYVHSKMMIIDDEYIIVGSANINQRSMGGTRDTEIAVGAMQPNYVYSEGVLPRGQVHGFRMALWAEHMGTVEECFLDPASKDCIEKVNAVAQENWEIYAAEDAEDTVGFLLAYPYCLKEGGGGELLDHAEGAETFPDFGPGAYILGNQSNFLPNKLTT